MFKELKSSVCVCVCVCVCMYVFVCVCVYMLFQIMVVKSSINIIDEKLHVFRLECYCNFEKSAVNDQNPNI